MLHGIAAQLDLVRTGRAVCEQFRLVEFPAIRALLRQDPPPHHTQILKQVADLFYHRAPSLQYRSHHGHRRLSDQAEALHNKTREEYQQLRSGATPRRHPSYSAILGLAMQQHVQLVGSRVGAGAVFSVAAATADDVAGAPAPISLRPLPDVLHAGRAGPTIPLQALPRSAPLVPGDGGNGGGGAEGADAIAGAASSPATAPAATADDATAAGVAAPALGAATAAPSALPPEADAAPPPAFLRLALPRPSLLHWMPAAPAAGGS